MTTPTATASDMNQTSTGEQQSTDDGSPDRQSLAADLAAELNVEIVLGGQRYARPAGLTFERRQYVGDAITSADLGAILSRLTQVGDDLELVAMAVMAKAYERGKLFVLLAGLLMPEGSTWSRASAARIADALAQLTDPADHAVIDRLILWLVLDFFLQTGPSGAIFLKSVIAPKQARDRDGAARRSSDPLRRGEGPSTSVTAMHSFETSPALDASTP
jgi:hypothetical protein